MRDTRRTVLTAAACSMLLQTALSTAGDTDVFCGRANDTDASDAGFLNVGIGSGWRASPLDEVVEDRFYAIRQYSVLDSSRQLRPAHLCR